MPNHAAKVRLSHEICKKKDPLFSCISVTEYFRRKPKVRLSHEICKKKGPLFYRVFMRFRQRKSPKTVKIALENVKDTLLGGQSCPFRRSKLPFYIAKVALLQGNRPSITPLFGVKIRSPKNVCTDYQ